MVLTVVMDTVEAMEGIEDVIRDVIDVDGACLFGAEIVGYGSTELSESAVEVRRDLEDWR